MLTGCRGFEVVVLFCNLGFRPSLGARTYYILPRRMLGTPPCPGLACISVLALSGLVATTLNSEVAPALTEITIGLQFQFPAAALRLHSVACKTYVCRVHLPFRPAVLGSEFCGSGLEWRTHDGRSYPSTMPPAP